MNIRITEWIHTVVVIRATNVLEDHLHRDRGQGIEYLVYLKIGYMGHLNIFRLLINC